MLTYKALIKDSVECDNVIYTIANEFYVNVQVDKFYVYIYYPPLDIVSYGDTLVLALNSFGEMFHNQYKSLMSTPEEELSLGENVEIVYEKRNSAI